MLMIAAAWLMPAVEAKDQFPVTISHALGTTIVNQPPERIVTLGWSSEDAVLALGKIPVGMPRYRFFRERDISLERGPVGGRPAVSVRG